MKEIYLKIAQEEGLKFALAKESYERRVRQLAEMLLGGGQTGAIIEELYNLKTAIDQMARAVELAQEDYQKEVEKEARANAEHLSVDDGLRKSV